jgi:tetratricopeptide (TPR) repeat protein
MPQRENMEMPEEVKELLAELTAKAEAAPESVEDWQNLTRALYRASVLNDTFQAGALEALEKLLELDDANLEGLRIAGNLSYDRGEFEEAEKNFHAFLKLSPDDVGVITDLGSSQLFRGAVEEAVTSYREAVELDPTFLQAWFNLGIALQRTGDVPGAQEALTKAEELAEAPEQKAFIREAIAAAGGAPQGLPPNHPPTGGTGSGPAGQAASATPAQSNASTDFQRQAQQLLFDHSIVGPKVTEIDWEGAAQARVLLKQFPMDRMPVVMLNRFKSRINEALAKLAEEQSITEPTRLDLVDADSGTVMDKLDGKEWIGAFDEAQYE